ncbi:MAG: hypothetical protein VX833_03645, partial [Actinomycetota bacterium]|nr:hypothetical protein [Actinomycetota bacterium]
HQRVAAASTLVLASGCGAITAPVVIGFLITVFGPTSYFLANATVLGILVSYLSYRTRVREAVPLDKQTTFQPVVARSGPIAHTVSDWIRHPLAGWSHGRRQGD